MLLTIILHSISTFMLVSANRTIKITAECESPCPTTCPAGYGPSSVYTQAGCDVFCTDKPMNGQCQVGGSGCSSSCEPCQELTPCPTSCPYGYVPGTEWINSDPDFANCPIYCMEEPVNGQCQLGGSGCTSSCYPAPATPTTPPTAISTISCESPCPTTCPAGYGPSSVYTQAGCDVFCTDKPMNGQCQVGGSGCSSSCEPCQELTPCPTSCPYGYVPGTEWISSDPDFANCPIYCMEEPANGQCQLGGSGCTSSCYPAPAKTSSSSSKLSSGAIAGIAVAILVILVGVLVAAQFFLGFGYFAQKPALAKQEREMTNKV